jgi:hypothetical protein
VLLVILQTPTASFGNYGLVADGIGNENNILGLYQRQTAAVSSDTLYFKFKCLQLLEYQTAIYSDTK